MSKKVNLEELLKNTDSDKLIAGLSYEDGIKLLDELVVKVEKGELSLDNAMHSYEKGMKLIERLRSLLAGAEEKLKVLQVD